MVEDSTVRREFNLMWLPTTAERIIGDLLTDASILDEAATGILSADERVALVRSPDAPGQPMIFRYWTKQQTHWGHGNRLRLHP